MPLSLEELKKLVVYNQETGEFFSRVDRVGVSVGTRMGCHHKTLGYVFIGLKNKRYLAHRLAWFYVTGEWPQLQIDHINCERADNRWCNLRLATISQNRFNSKKRKDNTSGYKGVHLHAKNRWRARIKVNGKYHHIGLFDSPKLAFLARRKALSGFHGSYGREG